jgi:alpha-mannosidase
LKMARHGPGVVLRLHESFGQPGEAVVDGLPLGWHAHTATVTEDVIDELPVRSGRFRVPMLPWQVVTVVATEGL